MNPRRLSTLLLLLGIVKLVNKKNPTFLVRVLIISPLTYYFFFFTLLITFTGMIVPTEYVDPTGACVTDVSPG